MAASFSVLNTSCASGIYLYKKLWYLTNINSICRGTNTNQVPNTIKVTMRQITSSIEAPYNALLRGGNTWAKIRSEATQPMCLRPSPLAGDYSRLLCTCLNNIIPCQNIQSCEANYATQQPPNYHISYIKHLGLIPTLQKYFWDMVNASFA